MNATITDNFQAFKQLSQPILEGKDNAVEVKQLNNLAKKISEQVSELHRGYKYSFDTLAGENKHALVKELTKDKEVFQMLEFISHLISLEKKILEKGEASTDFTVNFKEKIDTLVNKENTKVKNVGRLIEELESIRLIPSKISEKYEELYSLINSEESVELNIFSCIRAIIVQEIIGPLARYIKDNEKEALLIKEDLISFYGSIKKKVKDLKLRSMRTIQKPLEFLKADS